MLNIAPPKNKSELRSSIGMVNDYRDAWIRRFDVIAPLAQLCGKNSKWEWTNVHQHAFDTMEKFWRTTCFSLTLTSVSLKSLANGRQR